MRLLEKTSLTSQQYQMRHQRLPSTTTTHQTYSKVLCQTVEQEVSQPPIPIIPKSRPYSPAQHFHSRRPQDPLWQRNRILSRNNPGPHSNWRNYISCRSCKYTIPVLYS